MTGEAKTRYESFRKLYDKLDEHAKNADAETAEQMSAFMSIFG